MHIKICISPHFGLKTLSLSPSSLSLLPLISLTAHSQSLPLDSRLSPLPNKAPQKKL